MFTSLPEKLGLSLIAVAVVGCTTVGDPAEPEEEVRIAQAEPFVASSDPLASPRLLEGNYGYDGDWVFVANEGALEKNASVMWYRTGHDITYRAQFAADDTFADILIDTSGIREPSWGHPELDLHGHSLAAGDYVFRAAAIDASGTQGPWSTVGRALIVSDEKPPSVRILSPTPGSTVVKGTPLDIVFEAVDDALLRGARIEINGDYVGYLGLATENYKRSPSLGEPKMRTYTRNVPSNGKAGDIEVSIIVRDSVYRYDTTAVTVRTVRDRK